MYVPGMYLQLRYLWVWLVARVVLIGSGKRITAPQSLAHLEKSTHTIKALKIILAALEFTVRSI